MAPIICLCKFALFAHVRLDVVVVRTVALKCCTIQLLLCRGVCNRDKQTCALLKALAIEIYCTILGNKSVHMATGSYYTGTGHKCVANLRYALVGD